jgi:hypothetical protein
MSQMRSWPKILYQKYLNIRSNLIYGNAQARYKLVSSPLSRAFVVYIIEMHPPSPGGVA